MSYLRNLKQLRETMLSQAANTSTPEESSKSLIAARYNSPMAATESTESLLESSAQWLSKIKQSSEAAKGTPPRREESSDGGLFDSLSSGISSAIRKSRGVTEKEPVKKPTEPVVIEAGASVIAPRNSTQPVSLDAPVKAVLDAIAAVESRGSGDYAAIGPVVKKGMYSGQRAYGRYQVMEGNIGPWTRAALGKTLTKEEFLSSEAAQDQVAAKQLQASKDKFGTWEDAASVWFSGRPVKSAGNASDGYTTVPQYISKFRRHLKG